MHPKLAALLIFIVALSASHLVKASGSANEPINIKADYMQIDINTGDSIYRGNVLFEQGELKLRGEKIIVKNRNEKIDFVEIDGKPATYNHRDEAGNTVNAQSRHMEYSIENKQLTMIKDARLVQTDQVVESPKIIYDTANKVILAGQESTDNKTTERVNITINPKKEEGKTP